jgi:thiamine biosynthesis lipoprotein
MRTRQADKQSLSTTVLIVIVFVCLSVTTSCHKDRQHNADMFVFGTVVNISLWDTSPTQASQAFSDLQRMFQDMHNNWHAWETGQLTAINQAFANGQTATADPQMIVMIRQAQKLETLTGGRFNAAIGALIELWGFHTSDFPILGPPPSRNQIDDYLRQHPSSSDIQINGLELSSTNPAVQLDFGGIAKGLAVDLAIAHLHGIGIHNAIVNAGGDLRASGTHGDRPWKVAIQKPGGGEVGFIEVNGDEAIFTSGNYARFRQDINSRYPHILDPRSGWPASEIASVTVIADEGVVADAAATAMVVAGLKNWPEVARMLSLNQVAVIDEEGTVYLTPAMAQRIHFTGDTKTTLVPLGTTL